MGKPNKSKGPSSGSRKGNTRPPKKGANDEETLMTSPKSKLVNVDLIGFLSDPQTIALLTDAEKTEILAGAAENLGLDPANIPNDIFKHNNDFKGAVRQFQEDLASGKCDPLWIEEAAIAMEERAAGKFDAWKEQEFEEFWGQKQKLDYSVIAGESAKLKLDVLLKNNYFKVGDEWSYSRVFGRGAEKVHVEKDGTIISVGNMQITFAIAPGQQKYARLGQAPRAEDYKKLDDVARQVVDTMVGRSDQKDANIESGDGLPVVSPIMSASHRVRKDTHDVQMVDVAAIQTLSSADRLDDVDNGNENFKLDRDHKTDSKEVEIEEQDTANGGSNIPGVANGSFDGKSPAKDAVDTERNAAPAKPEKTSQQSSSEAQMANNLQRTTTRGTREQSLASELSTLSRTPPLEPAPPARSTRAKGKKPRITPSKTRTKTKAVNTALSSTSSNLHIYTLDLNNGNSLGALDDAILKIDGRVKNPPHGNAWKVIRCRRKNQDMGTLFEIREDYYVWKLGGTSGRRASG